MAIRSFSVGGRKTLVSASYDNLPDLVFITGGNGAGKSSLLALLRDGGQREPNTKVLHLGPHRPWRKGNLLKAAVLSMPMNFNDLLATTQIPHFQGQVPYSIANFQGLLRDPDASDEAQSLIKVALAGINEKYRDRLQTVHQEHGFVDRNAVPEPFEPLHDLLRKLLPHLVFDKIEEQDRNNVRVLFKSHFSQTGDSFDIDELSSGEKAVLTLFLSVLEYQMEKRLGLEHEGSSRTFLIDEPELHLHPALQADVVAYFRHLTKTEKIQFIVVTHSPTMIDAAQPDELFVVLPWQGASSGNQFSKLADTAERLVAIRQLLGSAYAYSRGRPILFIEGEFPQDTTKQTDLGLLELILPDLRGHVFVPSRGKTQAISGAERIRRAASEQEHVVTAFALVDADYDQNDKPWVFPWPVCMVENLLLDPVSIARILRPYVPNGALQGAGAVRDALVQILSALREEEIRRRLKSMLGVITVRPDIVVTNGTFQVTAPIEDAASRLTELQGQVASASETIIRQVDDALSTGTAFLSFHGKSILTEFHTKHVQPFIPKYINFVFATAQEVAESGFASQHVSETIRRVTTYFPPELLSLLRDPRLTSIAPATGMDIAPLISWAEEKLRVFNGAAAEGDSSLDRERDLVRLLNALREQGQRDLYSTMRPLVVDVLSR